MIELHIKGGGLVVALDPEQDPVIYMMNPKPDLVMWGERVFIKMDDTRFPSGRPVRYEEAFAVVAFTALAKEGKDG